MESRREEVSGAQPPVPGGHVAYSQEATVALHAAAEARDPEAMREALKCGACPNGLPDRAMPLAHCVRALWQEGVEVLLAHGASAQAHSDDESLSRPNSDEPLVLAIQTGQDDVAQQLLAAGVEARVCTQALAWAVEVNQSHWIAPLVGAGADPEAASASGWTPMGRACDGGYAGCVEALLDAGARGPAGPYAGRALEQAAGLLPARPFMRILETGRYSKGDLWAAASALCGDRDALKAEALIDHGVAPSKPFLSGATLLDEVVSRGSGRAVRKALRAGGRPFENRRGSRDALGSRGWLGTPVEVAACANNVAALEVLLEARAPARVLDEALAAAAGAGAVAAMGVLFEKGADLNGVARSGHTALESAIMGEYEEAVCFLLERGVPANGTPQASRGGVLRRLLRSAQGEQSPTRFRPIERAARRANAPIVRALLRAGATVETNAEGNGPLYEAIVAGADEVARELLLAGADPQAMWRGPQQQSVGEALRSTPRSFPQAIAALDALERRNALAAGRGAAGVPGDAAEDEVLSL